MVGVVVYLFEKLFGDRVVDCFEMSCLNKDFLRYFSFFNFFFFFILDLILSGSLLILGLGKK